MKFQRAIPFTILCTIWLLTFGGILTAQVPDKVKDEEKGFVFYEQFEGSSNTLGQVMKLDTSAGYNFNRFFGVDVGVPVYFVRASTTTSTSGATSNSGIGNVYVDLRLTVANPLVNYASTLTGMAPTGDTSKGFSTGRATFDWNNHFDRSFGPIRPFANVDFGNTIADTHFFARPFTSLGKVAQLEGGTTYKIIPFVRVGASAYDDLPTGQQKIFSRLLKRQLSASGGSGSARPRAGAFEKASETVGNADIARDNGFSAWADFNPIRYLDFEIGYTRSVHFDLNTVSFGVGVNLGSLAKVAKGL